MVCSVPEKSLVAKEKSCNEETGTCDSGMSSTWSACSVPEKCPVITGEYCNDDTGTCNTDHR